MKKAVCILLVLAVMLACCAVGVSANCTISEELRGQMEAAADDAPIRVNIWVNSVTMTEDELHYQAMTDAGFKIWEFDKLTSAQMNQYILARRSIESSLEQESCQRFIDLFGLEEESINYTIATCINANLTKTQIESAMNHHLVNAIYFDSQEELPTEAPTEAAFAESPYLYQARFEELYGYGYDWYDYQELYYHTDQNGELDWVLVYAFLPMAEPIELVTIVGNRVVFPGTMHMPFEACYGIYDVKKDGFIDAGSAEAKNYDGFFKVFDKIENGRLIGDLDRDGDLSVIDATILQRCDAMICDYPEDDVFSITFEWGKTRYYSDFDRDGERSILDATCLQRYLING